jgi:biopolymer transport protein ExbD/biopolymer transport protein TolR
VRRFSQRNSLVTLSEINITPLLDLAFVLLIIFVITRPMLEGSVKVQLPESDQGSNKIDSHNVVLVEITFDGRYWLERSSISVAQLELDLIAKARQNPKLIVDIRGDKRVAWESVMRVLDICLRNKIQVAPRVARGAAR